LLFWRPGQQGAQQRSKLQTEERDVRRPTNTVWWKRWWWKLRPPVDTMAVDGLVIERTGRRSHCLWLGPTGAGKSQSVATVRVNHQRPMLIVTPDLSDPFIPLADFHWTAGGKRSVDFLIGTPEQVAERLTEVFRSGGNGVWKMTARRAVTAIIYVLDSMREPRTLQAIGEMLADEVKDDRELRTACAGWVERFLSTAQQFGESIGAGGVDVAELLLQGKTVLLDNDAFAHPGLVGDVVAFGLAEAKRCADRVPGGFRLIFEEAGQLGDRIDLADPFFRAGRRRRIAVDALTQAESDLNDAISQNAATRVYFSQELQNLQKAAANRLSMDWHDLDPAVMQDFTAWITSGKIRRLVHFPKPRNARPPVTVGISYEATDGRSQVDVRLVVTEQKRWKGTGEAVDVEWNGPRMLPPPQVRFQKLVDGAYRDGACLRWKAHLRHDKDGYGEVWIDGEGRYMKVHRLAYELAYGAIPRNPDGTTMTVDHLSGVCQHKDCFELTHLELVTRAKNSSRRQAAAKARPKAGGSGGRHAGIG
jgi:hypothetical protein